MTDGDMQISSKKGSFLVRSLVVAGFFLCFSSAAFAQVLTITTASLPGGGVGTAYTAPALTATGGTGTLTWSLSGGTSLPPGLTISSTTGVISGTPTAPGSNFTIQVTDSSAPTPQTATKGFSITILAVTTASLPGGGVGTAYTAPALTASGGTGTLAWSLSGGTSLPPGLTISSATGVISGTPTAPGSNFTIQVTDGSSPALTAKKSFTITILAVSTASLPDGLVGAVYAAPALAAANASGTLTWSITGSLPPGLALSGTLIGGTPTSAGTFVFTVHVTDSSGPISASRDLTININGTLTITTPASLPNALVSTPYTFTFAATGGFPPYTWLNTSTLPPGLNLSSAGVLSGTPTNVGIFSFTVQVFAAGSPGPTRIFTLNVGGALAVSTSALPNGAVGKTYSQGVSAFGGSGTYTWALTAGTLPNGLTIGTDGTISGTPTTAATFNFSVSVTDTSTPPQTATRALSIVIQPALVITTGTNLPLAVVGAFYSQLLAATGPTPLTWSVISGITPPGLSVTVSGSLAGTPSVSGTFDLTVQARGGDPVQTATVALHMVVNDSLTIQTGALLPDAPLGSNYTATLQAKGGLAPYTWTILDGRLPTGVTLSNDGVLSGTPSGVGNFTFTIQVADSFNPTQRASRSFSIAVSTVVSITTTTLPHAIQNVAYSQQLQATGTGPFTWIVSVGILPNGITLNATGLIQGTPTDLISQTFTARVTDSRGGSATKDFTLTIDAALPVFSAPGLPTTLSTRQTANVALSLATPFPSALTGTLKLTFTSIAEVPADDPMTQFSTGTRLVTFSIPANTTAAVFTPNIMLLTGTVAGTVKLTATIDSGPADLPVASVDIPAVAPQITNITATRGAGGLDVQITGFAPSRRVSTVQFSFDVKVGNTTNSVPLSRSVDADFGTWYTNPASVSFGSAFSFVQSFTIQGDATAITGVTVKLTNAQGSTTSATVQPK
jgi:hypothetical protein